MTSCLCDEALFFNNIEEHYVCACATSVDDKFHLGNEEYPSLTESTEQKFKHKPKQF